MKTSDIEKIILARCQKYGWKTDPNRDIRNLMEEIGEMSREVRRLEDGRERPDETEDDREEIVSHLAEEIGDILFPLVKIAHHYGITLEDAFRKHEEKMAERYEKKEMLLVKAEEVATYAHEGQTDKGGHPYIEHPRRVAARLKTIDQKIVGFLHDVVEDTKGIEGKEITLEDLRNMGFPAYIVDAVDAITKRKKESYDQYLYRVFQNDLARAVKLADIAENMDLSRIPNVTDKDKERVKKYAYATDVLLGKYKWEKVEKKMKWVKVA